jgi:hypothetical protein
VKTQSIFIETSDLGTSRRIRWNGSFAQMAVIPQRRQDQETRPWRSNSASAVSSAWPHGVRDGCRTTPLLLFKKQYMTAVVLLKEKQKWPL